MIFGNINQLEQQLNHLPKVIQNAVIYLKKRDFSKINDGKYEILPNRKMYASIATYQTKSKEEKKGESHRKYIDVQYIISGKETIGHAFPNQKNKILRKYSEEKESILYGKMENEMFITMRPGNFVVFFPYDLHRPGCNLEKSMEVRKVVVKIDVSLV